MQARTGAVPGRAGRSSGVAWTAGVGRQSKERSVRRFGRGSTTATAGAAGEVGRAGRSGGAAGAALGLVDGPAHLGELLAFRWEITRRALGRGVRTRKARPSGADAL